VRLCRSGTTPETHPARHPIVDVLSEVMVVVEITSGVRRQKGGDSGLWLWEVEVTAPTGALWRRSGMELSHRRAERSRRNELAEARHWAAVACRGERVVVEPGEVESRWREGRVKKRGGVSWMGPSEET